ncbi:MAG: hypothetical protein HKL86_03550 [Acidimicrobiaceae bacterium]|nr:hypothetical protein [Acidimicrobiaceae bacterium]
MTFSTLVVGSLPALRASLEADFLGEVGGADTVIVPTAAAFTGAAQGAIEVAQALEGLSLRMEGLMVTDRQSAREPHFVLRASEADLVILSDGSVLHARTVWRDSPFGDSLRTARRLVAVGSVATVIGEVMIDPRGGAPTTALGWRPGLTMCVEASDEQLERTRSLLREDQLLAVIGPSGVLGHDGEHWKVLAADVTVTRGHEVVDL